MADEDDSSKTEAPSGKRLEEARSRGGVPKSKEIDQAVGLVAGMVVISLLLPPALEHMKQAFAGFLETAWARPVDAGGVGDLLRAMLFDVLKTLALIFATLLVTAYLPGAIQTGFLFTTEPLKPNLERLNPFGGLGKLFSVQNIVEIAKAVVKMTIVAALCVWLLKPMLDHIESFTGMEVAQVLIELKRLVLRLVLGVAIVLAALAAADFLYQRFKFMKDLRMTKQEVKEEFKQAEGDPMVKARLRQKRIEKARRRMMAAVPKADVVVTNPTHFAIALKYDSNSMQAPVLLAKGIDAVALKIREVAEAHDIPIVENPPLARTLYATVELDQEIPPEHYRAVAEVISFVFKLKRKL